MALAERAFEKRGETKIQRRAHSWNSSFWETVLVTKCCKYNIHLAKTLPKVVECENGPRRMWDMFEEMRS